jgi:hypothetical protein
MKCKYLTLLGLSCALLLTTSAALAQQEYLLDTPEWAEDAVPPPPAFSSEHLIAIDMPPHVTVKVGVDPETIVVGKDGVVRYVMVMRNATGNTNAVYEGVRCTTDEVKTYARSGASGQWSMRANAEWKAVNDNQPSPHAQIFARQGGCKDHFAPAKQEIIDSLNERQKMPAHWKGN